MAEAPARPPRRSMSTSSSSSVSVDDDTVPVAPPRTQWGDAQHLNYFHPHLTTMDQVKNAMLPHIDQNGAFLVRISTSREKTFTASVVHRRAIKHFKILRKNQQYYLQNTLFNSLDELINSYYEKDVPNMENIEHVRLSYPIVNRERDRYGMPRASNTTQSTLPLDCQLMDDAKGQADQQVKRKSNEYKKSERRASDGQVNKGSMELRNRGSGERGNRGSGERGNRGSSERGNRGSSERGNRGSSECGKRGSGERDNMSSVDQGYGNPDDDARRRLGQIGPCSVDEEEDPGVAFYKLFRNDREPYVRQLPPPPGSRLIPEQAVPGAQRVQSEISHSLQSLQPMPSRLAKSTNLEQRPPAPIPTEDTGSGDSAGIYNGVYYSCIKRKEENKLPQLLEQLSVSSATESTHCECGLDIELSQLPMGWSVHISREPDSGYGRPFFVGPTQITKWDPPKEIYLELNRHQQKFIRFLCDNYDKGNPPPDENTQIEWSSSSSDSYSGQSSVLQSRGLPNHGGASSGDRDSTGSNTGASHGGLVSRGVTDVIDGSGAEAAM